jgi:hypothetical protein
VNRIPKKLIHFFLALLIVALTAPLLGDNGPEHQATQTPPVKLGTSGGNINDISRKYCCSGTLGSLVSKGGVQYILSNNHVLARSDQAAVGEDISQPGLVDSNCQPGQIVADYSSAAKLGTNVDAALAAVRSSMVDTSGAILDVGVPASGAATPTVGRGVAKSGRTTGLTCASVQAVNTNVRVSYQAGCGTGKKFTVSYTNQVLIQSTTFSAGGDSGSLIVTTDTAQPLALLFAGSTSTTIGNPIGEVMSKLGGITFVGGNNHAVTCLGGKVAAAEQIAPSPAQAAIDRVAAIKDHYAPGLMRDPAVLAVGVGADPDQPGEAAVVIFINQHMPLLRPIPRRLETARTLVFRTDEIRAYGWNERASGGACSAR